MNADHIHLGNGENYCMTEIPDGVFICVYPRVSAAIK